MTFPIDLAAPVTAAINKFSEAVEGIARPWQTRRVGKANLEVMVEEEKARIALTEEEHASVLRMLAKGRREQENAYAVLQKAIPHIDAQAANPSGVSDDWLTNLASKCRITTDEDMREMFARILAGELNEPGRFSRKAVNVVDDMGRDNLQAFCEICRFVWVGWQNAPVLFVYDANASIYAKQGINRRNQDLLDGLNLVEFIAPMTRSMDNIRRAPVDYEFRYAKQRVRLTMPSNGKLPLGTVHLTRIGRELYPCLPSSPAVPDLLEYVVDHWAKNNLNPRLCPAID